MTIRAEHEKHRVAYATRIDHLKKQVATLRGAASKHGRAALYYDSLKAVAASRYETSRSHDHLAAMHADVASPVHNNNNNSTSPVTPAVAAHVSWAAQPLVEKEKQ